MQLYGGDISQTQSWTNRSPDTDNGHLCDLELTVVARFDLGW